MKKLLFSAALLMGATAISFAGNPKGEAKEPTPTTTEANAGTNYYWFDVTADGTALLDNSGIPLSQSPTPSGDCQGLQQDFCQRGYTEAQTTVSGGKRVVNIPIEDSPAEDHKQ